MIPLQTIALMIGLVAVYLSFLYYKRKDFTKLEFLLWAGLWVGFILVTLFPRSLDFLVERFAFTRAMDLIMVISFFVLFSLSFHNYIINHRTERKVEKLVRDEALRTLKDFESK